MRLGKFPLMLAMGLVVTLPALPSVNVNAAPVPVPLLASVPAAPPTSIVGLRLNMNERTATQILNKMGRKEREEGEEEEEREEVWAIKHEQFSHVVVGYDEKGVRYITAVANASAASRMRYTDVADTAQAEQRGDPQRNNFHYAWTLEANGKTPKMLVVARGRDPQFLETFSLKRL